MDITGSIADATGPLSSDIIGSLPETGSSALDTVFGLAGTLPQLLLGIAASMGADLGSTMGGPVIG